MKISDRKKRLPGTTPAFEAVIETAQDYYPFGSLMPGRKYNAGEYRFGFNGQEKDDEIAGVTGSHTTALFWEYDTRLGRRWNVDPESKAYMSPFTVFSDNPIIYIDPKGNTDYYNKRGKRIGSDGIANNIKEIALSKSTASEIKMAPRQDHFISIDKAIYRDIINKPTSSEISAMDRAYSNTEVDQAHEEGFVSGRGKITDALPGSVAHLPAKANIDLGPAITDHTSDGTAVTFSAHTHYTQFLESGSPIIDNAWTSDNPSGDDYLTHSAKEAIGIEYSATLGWDTKTFKNSDTKKTEVTFGKRMVNFYDSKGDKGSISFDRLRKAVNRIDK